MRRGLVLVLLVTGCGEGSSTQRGEIGSADLDATASADGDSGDAGVGLCGDRVCAPDEDSASCCFDCGCEPGFACFERGCVESHPCNRDQRCDEQETPLGCPDDCAPNLMGMWWGAVNSGCFLDEERWTAVDDPVHMALGNDAPPPSSSAPEAFEGLRGVLYWYVRKAGKYRLRVTIPPRPCYAEKGYMYAANVLYALKTENDAALFTFPHVAVTEAEGVRLFASDSTLLEVGTVEIHVFNYAPEGDAVVVSAGFSDLLWEGTE